MAPTGAPARTARRARRRKRRVNRTMESRSPREALPVMIDIQNVRKAFPTSHGEVVALDGIDLTIRQGDIYGVIGMSGAGKSTLIRCVNRLERPTDGHILIGGEDILAANEKDLLRLRRQVGMIFQQFNLLMQSTVEKNILFPMEISGVARGAARKRVKELLEIVGLSDKASAYPAQLSGGQKQRVAIARTLATNPSVLLCDEATSALDPMTTKSILELLQKLNRELGITIVVITHEMQVIRQICTQVAIINDGRIAEKGDVAEIFTNPRTPAARRLFGIPEGSRGQSGQCIRIVFDGGMYAEPVVSEMVLELGVPVSILQAEIKRIRGRSIGEMILRMPDSEDDAQRAIRYLRQRQLTVEEVEISHDGEATR